MRSTVDIRCSDLTDGMEVEKAKGGLTGDTGSSDLADGMELDK